MWQLVISYISCLLITIWGIHLYIHLFKHPIYLLIPVILSISIPISIIFLLPLDYVQHHGGMWFDVPDHVILYLWKFKYWITFLLTWLILPVLQEFYKSGQYYKRQKFVQALKRNVRFQLIMLGVSVVAIIYLLLESGLSFGHMKSMIIALSHIYALILALWLMAHGLINICRNKWTFGNVVNNLNYYYLKVPKLIDDLEDCKISFKEDVLQVLVLYKNFTNEVNETFIYRDWIIELYNKIPDDLKELMELQYLQDNSNNSISRDQLNNDFMTKLTARFNSNLYKLTAFESEFDTLFTQIILLEDVLNSSYNNYQFRFNSFNSFLSPKYRFLYYNYMNPILNRIYSMILFLGSFVIIESELFHSTKLSLVNLIFNHIDNNVVQFIFCGLTFCYMLICSLNSLTKLKIFNMYHLVPRHSDPVSTCFYSTYVARLTIPLSYNFVTLFISRDSTFEDWFGKSIHLTGLFNLMNNWVPRLILIPIILTVFNVYDKLKRRLGLTSDLYDSFGFDDAENDQPDGTNKRKDMIIVEAKRIISREFNKRQSSQAQLLRPFNLQQAADMNYQNNRAEFQNNLINTSNRIDYQDDMNSSEGVSSGDGVGVGGGFFDKLGTQFSSFRDQLSSTFTRGRQPTTPYHDEPLDNFDYDEDANNDLVL